jgi:hypothetical protein
MLAPSAILFERDRRSRGLCREGVSIEAMRRLTRSPRQRAQGAMEVLRFQAFLQPVD